MFREDGKTFKKFSLKQLDMKSSQMAQHVQLERDGRVVSMKFPNTTWLISLVDHKVLSLHWKMLISPMIVTSMPICCCSTCRYMLIGEARLL